MLPPKDGKPITFKPTKELRERTEDCADTIGLSLSDYVRKAVEEYNKKFPCFDSAHKNDTVNKPTMLSELSADDMGSITKQLRQPKQVQTFFKNK